MSDTIEVKFERDNEDGETIDEVVYTFPAKNEVCWDCEGHGYVLTPGMRDYAYTSSDEEMHDPEFREEYFKRGGIYDVQCPTCKGRNVVPAVDESRLSDEQKKQYAEYQEHEEAQAQADAEYEAESRMERLMGC